MSGFFEILSRLIFCITRLLKERCNVAKVKGNIMLKHVTLCSQNKKEHRWVKKWYEKKDEHAHEKLLSELRVNRPINSRNFLRMNSLLFDRHLRKVALVMRCYSFNSFGYRKDN